VTNEELFAKYIDTCNQAIKDHRSDLFYRPFLALAGMVYDNKTFNFELCSGKTRKPVDYFRVKYHNERCSVSEHRKQRFAGFHWKIDKDYIQNVVANPSPYLKHPYKLDLDWLRSRLGFKVA
jgi:hypothetical protein